MTSLDNQAKVGRKSTTIAGTSGFFIGVGRGEVIGKLARTFEHLAFVVGAILILELLSKGLDLIGGV
jgi:hypothetical protein